MKLLLSQSLLKKFWKYQKNIKLFDINLNKINFKNLNWIIKKLYIIKKKNK